MNESKTLDSSGNFRINNILQFQKAKAKARNFENDQLYLIFIKPSKSQNFNQNRPS